MKDLIPAKSAKVYDQPWAAFIAFNKNGGLEEEDFLRYFHHLKHKKIARPQVFGPYILISPRSFNKRLGAVLRDGVASLPY